MANKICLSINNVKKPKLPIKGLCYDCGDLAKTF